MASYFSWVFSWFTRPTPAERAAPAEWAGLEQIVDGKLVSLAQRGNDLTYLISTLETREKLLSGKIATDLTAPEMRENIDFITKNEIILNVDGSPVITQPIKTWEIGEDKELKLFRRKEDLVWQLVNKTSHKKLNQTLADGVLEPSERCGNSVKRQIRYLRRSINQKDGCHYPFVDEDLFLENIDSKIDYIEDLQIVKVGESPSFKVYCEPRLICASAINNRVLVSKFHWAVTLLRRGSSVKKVSPCLRNHAQIVIEGIADQDLPFKDTVTERTIKKNEYFMLLIDFDGDSLFGGNGVVEIRNFTTSIATLTYLERSKVWKRPLKQMAEALNSIIPEAYRQVPVPKLNGFGSKSIFAKKGEHNCFTWAREKFEIMGIVLNDAIKSFLVSLTSDYTEPKEFYLQKDCPDDGCDGSI